MFHTSHPIDVIWAVMIVWRIRGMCTTIVHNHKHTWMSSSYRCTRDCWFRFSLGYSVCNFCMFYLYRASLFVLWFIFLCFWCAFSCLFCFELSVPVQVISWKDSCPKWPVMCGEGRKTTQSLTQLFVGWREGHRNSESCASSLLKSLLLRDPALLETKFSS